MKVKIFTRRLFLLIVSSLLVIGILISLPARVAHRGPRQVVSKWMREDPLLINQFNIQTVDGSDNFIDENTVIELDNANADISTELEEVLINKAYNLVSILNKSLLSNMTSLTWSKFQSRFLNLTARTISQLEQLLEEKNVKLFLAQPIINEHNFSYVYNSQHVCSQSPTDLMIVVPSAPGNFERRRTVRQGQVYNYVRDKSTKAKLLFFLGRPVGEDNTTTQEKLHEEIELFGDLVQEDFEDVYRNNRLKSVSMLRWLSSFCHQTKYVIRMDDDVSANVSALASELITAHRTWSKFILGKAVENEIPKRKTDSKYFMSYKEYPNRTFPPFLLGGLQGYTWETARLLYQAALRVPPIWLEDAYITGICASKVYVPILYSQQFIFQHKE